MTRPKRQQAGDTIVEVLIAVAVVSAVIVGAFTIANRSSQQIRASQERSEALKLTSSAVETVKVNASFAQAIDLNKPYCISPTFNTMAMVDGGALPALVDDTTDLYVAACNSTGNVPYSTSVVRVDSSTFKVHTRWDRVGGGERQDITMDYRINQ